MAINLHTVKRGGEMKAIEVVSMIKINGSWVNQEDLKKNFLRFWRKN